MSVTTILVVVEPESMPRKTSCFPFLKRALGSCFFAMRSFHALYSSQEENMGRRAEAFIPGFGAFFPISPMMSEILYVLSLSAMSSAVPIAGNSVPLSGNITSLPAR